MSNLACISVQNGDSLHTEIFRYDDLRHENCPRSYADDGLGRRRAGRLGLQGRADAPADGLSVLVREPVRPEFATEALSAPVIIAVGSIHNEASIIGQVGTNDTLIVNHRQLEALASDHVSLVPRVFHSDLLV
jgi:hypothetical protein